MASQRGRAQQRSEADTAAALCLASFVIQVSLPAQQSPQNTKSRPISPMLTRAAFRNGPTRVKPSFPPISNFFGINNPLYTAPCASVNKTARKENGGSHRRLPIGSSPTFRATSSPRRGSLSRHRPKAAPPGRRRTAGRPCRSSARCKAPRGAPPAVAPLSPWGCSTATHNARRSPGRSPRQRW